ncbi:Protein of unknown function [Bacillus wiedmannii]|nr:Protein of unknown function [Bacillus wiedmannii]
MKFIHQLFGIAA